MGQGKDPCPSPFFIWVLYPDLDLEEAEEQEKEDNRQGPLQNLLAEKLLHAAADHPARKTANDDGNHDP